VLVGGKLGSGGYRIATPLDVFVSLEEAAELCASIALIFRDHGLREARARVRLAFLLEERGEAWLRTELEARLGRCLPAAGEDQRSDVSVDHIGLQAQKQPGLNAIGLLAPVGRITGEQLLGVAALADEYGSGDVLFTVGQNLIIPNVSDERIPALMTMPLLSELSPTPSPIRRGMVSCTGIDYCNLALIDTKNIALGLASHLEGLLPEGRSASIHWSGCPAGCGNHHVADIGLEGKRVRVGAEVVEAVDVYVGGRSDKNAKLATKVLEDVPCSRLSEVLATLLVNESSSDEALVTSSHDR
jgi:ferredoxin-nitrite reductase